MDIYYNNVRLNNASAVKKHITAVQPDINIDKTRLTLDETQLYLLVMNDPDAVPYYNNNDKTKYNKIHWCFYNVVFKNGVISSYDVYQEYVGPNPPFDTDVHHYFITLYRQPHHVVLSPMELQASARIMTINNLLKMFGVLPSNQIAQFYYTIDSRDKLNLLGGRSQQRRRCKYKTPYKRHRRHRLRHKSLKKRK